jgi:endonuclease/exonuclease/phosphatase family metal-dependent hydrolase
MGGEEISAQETARRILMRLRIATYNIHRCVGRDGKENVERVAAVLREINGDIVALQEVTSRPAMTGDMLAYLAAAVHMQPIEGFTLSAAGAHYGNALLTNLPISAVRRHDISVPGREARGVIEVTFTVDGHAIIVWATHLGLGIRERHLQIRKLLKTIHAADVDARILLGDFNEWLSWSRPLRALHRWFKISPTIARSPATFPARRPLLRLDRIWVRPARRLVALRTHSTEMSRIASDHLPLVGEILL